MKIIVTADDFGLDELTTESIIEFMESGYCTQTSVMVNMSYSDAAVMKIKNGDMINRVGLHLNLSEGSPLTDRIKSDSDICGRDGFFRSQFHSGKSAFILSKQQKELLSDEIEEQMKKYLSYGFTRMSLDSHNHVHTHYSIFRIVKPLLSKYGFRYIRISRNMGEGLSIIKKVYKSALNSSMSRQAKTTDYFGNVADFQKTISKIEMDKTIEIMTHPKRMDNSSAPLYDADRLMDETYGILDLYKDEIISQ